MNTMTAGEPARSTVTLRLDKSKAYSTVHGDRNPQDPHYRVHFWQGDLPFDVNGILVPDNGNDQEIAGVDVDSKPTIFRPLYTPARRAVLEKRMMRLRKVARAPEPQHQDPDLGAQDDDDAALTAAASDVNLESWLRGEVQHEADLIFKAFEARFHHKTRKLGEVVNELVFDEKIVRPEEVTPYLARYLPDDAKTPEQLAFSRGG